jgi:hypothetical protein
MKTPEVTTGMPSMTSEALLADGYSSSSLDASRPVVDHAGRAKLGAAGVK